MRRFTAMIISVAVGLSAGTAQAGTIWQWTHDASGEGTAHVFDGGPVVSDSGSTRFSALDLTRPGSLGAFYATGGRSQIFTNDEQFRVRVNFNTGYVSSSLVGGDRPGGEGEGSLSSVVEFVMPADQLELSVGLNINIVSVLSGSSSVRVENLTQSTTVLELSSTGGILETLVGNTGDVIRITTQMSGGGSVPPGVTAIRVFDTEVGAVFTVPEPTTLSLLGLGVLPLLRRKRRE